MEASRLMPKEWGQLERLYRELPTIDCQMKCHTSCGPIAMQRAEIDRIEKRLGGRLPRPRNDIDCPLLTRDNRCGVHGIRPLICRLWGLSVDMPCIYGCEPEPRPLSHEETHDFMRRVREISPEAVFLGTRPMGQMLTEIGLANIVEARKGDR
jgi:uncharacterized protein